MSWTPDHDSLAQLATVFENSLSKDNNVRQQAAGVSY